MIITCPSCKKKFVTDEALIPYTGRVLQCGSCNHQWFFKKKEDISENASKKETINIKNKSFIQDEIKKEEQENSNKKALVKYQKKESVTLGGILRYILVSIISFVTLIIFLDTVKIPLSNIFPNLEFMLFSLYETLKDIILFIKNLI